jgi:uncharacterized membrane protein
MRPHLHPANRARHDNRSTGQRAADTVSGFMGSWRFIGLQTVLIVLWIAANAIALAAHWDPYPFVLLNLLFSVQAAYASPLILLAQNRQTEHDRMRAEADYAVTAEIYAELQALHTEHRQLASDITGRPSTMAVITAKITCTQKDSVTVGDTTQTQLSFAPDYTQGRNASWAAATPALSLNMTVNGDVAEHFDTGQPYTLQFEPDAE